MNRVSDLRKASPPMVEPMASPRKRVTMLAISFDEAWVSRSTAPDSRMRLPSMSMPIRGVAKGTRLPTMTVMMIGKMMRVRRLILREL